MHISASEKPNAHALMLMVKLKKENVHRGAHVLTGFMSALSVIYILITER